MEMLGNRTLAAVRALASYHSFHMAADSLGMSTATLSRHIGKAEAFCGFALFERRRNGSALTEDGERFLRLAEDYTASLARFETGLRLARKTSESFLRIGCGPLTTDTVIAPVLESMLLEQPDLRMKLVVRATKEPVEELRAGTLDIVVVDLTHTSDLPNLDIRVLDKRSVSFFARADHPIHARGPLTAREIFDYKLASAHLHKHWRATVARMLGGDHAAWSRVEEMPAIECDDSQVLIRLTRHTDHVCAGMRETFAGAVESGSHLEVELAHPLPWNICAARRQGHSSPAMQKFWQMLLSEHCSQRPENSHP